jgi:hypothetical protein
VICDYEGIVQWSAAGFSHRACCLQESKEAKGIPPGPLAPPRRASRRPPATKRHVRNGPAAASRDSLVGARPPCECESHRRTPLAAQPDVHLLFCLAGWWAAAFGLPTPISRARLSFNLYFNRCLAGCISPSVG